MRATGHDERGVLGGALGEACGHGDTVGVDVLERPQDLQLLDVLGEVAAGHALVDVLVTGEGVELLDASLDVVTGDAFALCDGLEVDLLDHAFVVGDRLGGNVDPEFGLRPQHREPQLPLEHDLVLGRPQVPEFGAGVAGGEDVGDVAHTSEFTVRVCSHIPRPQSSTGGRDGLDDVEQDAARERARVGIELAQSAEDRAVHDRHEPGAPRGVAPIGSSVRAGR